MKEKKKYGVIWRVLVIIAAVVGAFVAAEVILEKVFKKYLKIVIELGDVDELEDEFDGCCNRDDEDEAEADSSAEDDSDDDICDIEMIDDAR